MSHFAKVNNGIVVNVIVAEADFFKTFIDTSPGTWIKTSYNTRGGEHYDPVTGQINTSSENPALRANYAGIGYIYDSVNDVFYPPRPSDRNGVLCVSWTIGAPTWLWQPPTPMPTTVLNAGEYYVWDEPTKTWISTN